MKKILAIIISATMLLSLSSCANSNGTSTADKETTKDSVSGEDDGGNSDATKNNNSRHFDRSVMKWSVVEKSYE